MAEIADEKVWSNRPIEISERAAKGKIIRWNGVLYRIDQEDTDGKGNKQITLVIQ